MESCAVQNSSQIEGTREHVSWKNTLIPKWPRLLFAAAVSMSGEQMAVAHSDTQHPP